MVYPIVKLSLLPIWRLWLRKVEGLDNVPKDEPFIIAANHSSYYDAILLHSIIIPKIDKKIHAMSDSYYWKFFILRIIFELGENIPIFIRKEKNAKEKNKKASEKALNYLKKSEIILIFPEGRRSPDGKLQKAYTGIAKLALKAKTPVLPIGIIGANKVLPRGAKLPRLTRCEVKIGKLICFDQYYDVKTNGKVFEEVTRIIMKQIAKLINQKYNY